MREEIFSSEFINSLNSLVLNEDPELNFLMWEAVVIWKIRHQI